MNILLYRAIALGVSSSLSNCCILRDICGSRMLSDVHLERWTDVPELVIVSDLSCFPEIPKQMVKFSCGVEVELRFKTVFSNLIHTFAKLTHTPAHLTDIKIILYKPSVSDHFFIMIKNN